MKYKPSQFKTLNEEQKKEYFFERQEVCNDFVMDENGRCARRIETKDKGVHLCNYKEHEEIKDEHFVCEFSEEYRKEIVRVLCER